MADRYPSLLEDEPDPDDRQPPNQLDSLVNRLTMPVKKCNPDVHLDLEAEPVAAEFNGSVPAAMELNGSLPVVEENNGRKHEIRENGTLQPVLPGETGEGLPYAPENWPNPGDNWKWRVGQRYNSAGYFMDRFLYVPKRLQKIPTSKQMFASKSTIEKYIRSEFPDADVNAFFATFSWKVPAKRLPLTKEAACLPREDTPVNGVEKDNTVESKDPSSPNKRSSMREKRPRITMPVPPTPPLSQRDKRPRATAPSSFKPEKQERIVEETPRSSTRKKGRRSSRLSTIFASNNQGSREHVPKEPTVEVLPIPSDFDNYLSSLEDILTQPLPGNLPSNPRPSDTHAAEDEMAEARNKLSSLLMMDFPTLVSSNYYSELVTLATKLRKDPRLTAEQLVKLKLIEEISLFSEVYLECREIIEEVSEHFTNLASNKSKVSSLKNEYNELKEKADQLQAQVDSNAVAVQEIDNRIAQLQAWRAQLVAKIESNKSSKTELMNAQKMVANGIPPLVQEIQVSNAKIPDWEMRRSNAERCVGEILSKFAPLQGFSV